VCSSDLTGTAGNTISFTQAMTLDASGNLLVGTTTANWSTAGRGLVEINGSSSFLFGGKVGGTQTAYFAGSSGGAEINVTTNNPLIFSTNNTERARITSGGYFKASNAGTYLDAAGTYHEMRQSANEICVDFSATNASFTDRIITTRATKAAASDFKFISSIANAVEQFYLRGDGVLYAQNTTIQSLSDGRLKENVRNATDGLSVINALRPVRYDWKEGFGNNRKDQLGFIAQEVEAVFPDAVSEWQKAEGDEEAYKTVGPGALIPVLVKAIQELKAELDATKAKVAALESK
jgi:hypothetical protein